MVTLPCYSQVSLSEGTKRYIVRLETPESILGTGFLVADSEHHLYIVTAKHLIRSKHTAEYFDHVYFRKNILSDFGKYIATDEKYVLILKLKDKILFQEHRDPDVDLVLIPLGKVVIDENLTIQNPEGFEIDKAFASSGIATRSIMDSLNIRDGKKVQIVGFSFQSVQKPQFHISRFGHIALYNREKMRLSWKVELPDTTFFKPIAAEWIVIDITSRGGDSGAPVFAILPGVEEAWIIGIVKGGSEMEEFCLAIPSYYLTDLLESAKKHWAKPQGRE